MAGETSALSAGLEIIQTVGFPIAVCIACFWYIYKMQIRHSEELERVQSEHREESLKLTEALNNNTLVMQKLVDKLAVSEVELSAVSLREG